MNIPAPSLRPPRVSILSSAEVIDIPGDKWWGGIEVLKLSGDPAAGTSDFTGDDIFTVPICPADSTNKDSFPRLGSQRSGAFAIYATDDCSSYGTSATNFLDRAKQKLAVNEPWTIERVLWDGDSNNDNFSFVNSDLTPLTTSAHPLRGFALLDATVARNRTDGRGMIHVTPEVFVLLQQYKLFRREGNVWFSPNDNIVVPGRGYSGNGPSGADATSTVHFMFGHPGIIQIVRSDVLTFPQDEASLATQMNRLTNDIWVVAERVVAYVIQNGLDDDDSSTDVFSVSVDLTEAVPA